MKTQENNDLGFVKFISLIIMFYLLPAIYYIAVPGTSGNPTKIVVTNGLTLEFISPWYLNVVIVSLLLTSLLIVYILSTEIKAVITPFILSFSLSFGFIFFHHIFSVIEFYSVLILILATGIVFTPLLILAQILKEPISEEIVIGSLLGLIYGIGLSTLVVFDPIVGFVTSVISFLFFAVLYKIREMIIKILKPIQEET